MQHYSTLIHPLITEKTARAEVSGVYAFRVHADANKAEVKKAVESLFGTKVTQVRMLNTQEKTKRRGRTEGRIMSWKKAMVTLEKGKKLQLKAEEPKTKVKVKSKKAETEAPKEETTEE